MQAFPPRARRRAAATGLVLTAGLAVLGCLQSTSAIAGQTPVQTARTDCASDHATRIIGDTPGAISFDVYRQMHPVTAQHLALFVESGQAHLLHDGMPVCKVKDDGVEDPRAVLVRTPADKMSYWVNSANLENGS